MKATRWAVPVAALAAPLLAGSLAIAGGSLPTERPGARTARNDAKVELGRRLFFDPAVSRSGNNSCASCHDPEHGFSDPQRRSVDDQGFTRRHSQTILDADANPTAHWDGEFDSVEALATSRLGPMTGEGSYGGSPGSPGERTPPTPPPFTPDDLPVVAGESGAITIVFHGIHDVTAVVDAAGRYREGMTAAFGHPNVTLERMAKALGAYVRSVRSTLSPYDRYVRGEKTALDESAQRGLALFKGRATCSQCHVLDSKDKWPLFTDYKFHDTGIAWKAGTFPAPAENVSPNLLESLIQADGGRQQFSVREEDRRTFKTPTLRDVALRGPYMHDGSLRTLDEVVRYYAKGCTQEPNLDPKIRPFAATSADVADLVAFLRSMTGEVRPGLAPSAWSHRAAKSALRFVNGRGDVVPGLPVIVEPAGDTLPGDLPLTSPTLRLVTDAEGRISYATPLRTHARLVLPEGLLPEGGALVPDTCREADIRLPIAGKCTVVVTLPPGVAAPDTMMLIRGLAVHFPHVSISNDRLLDSLPVNRRPMRRVQALQVGDSVVAAYETWVRTDLSNEASVLVPGWPSGRSYPIVHLAAGATEKLEAP